jgi:Mn-dependent DtxR family transcriptional regulator
MLADRCGTGALNVTQATLATMLGISRPSLTLIALDLKRRGMIDYVRDAVVLLDRPGLERAACECYRVLRDLDRRSPLRH